jgi:hypothetical protein
VIARPIVPIDYRVLDRKIDEEKAVDLRVIHTERCNLDLRVYRATEDRVERQELV